MHMDYQRPDPDQEAPQYGARVEDDFVRPLQPMKSISHRRLPAALPLAIAGILVVSSIAFGAAVIRYAETPPPDASTIDVGDESSAPSVAVSEAPPVTVTEAPVVTPLTLTASISSAKVALSWTKYVGDDFCYYKVVRSTDATVSWPLGEGDTLVAAIGDVEKLSLVDAAPAGKTYSYEVFAVKSADDGYAVIVGSNVVTIAVPAPTPTPKPTPKPTQNCNMTLTASLATASVGGIQPAVVGSPAPPSGYKVNLSWTKYRCDHFQWYGIVFNTTGNPVLHLGEQPPIYLGGIGTLSYVVKDGLEPGHTYYFRVYAYNEEVVCHAGTILGWSNVASVTIP
jgi:hypothetical protein